MSTLGDEIDIEDDQVRLHSTERYVHTRMEGAWDGTFVAPCEHGAVVVWDVQFGPVCGCRQERP